MAGFLKMTEGQIEQIRREAQEAYPSECCGVIVGRDEADHRYVDHLVPVPNVAPQEQRRNRFLIDPLRLMDVERSLEGSNLSVVGMYHSHPDHPARPSETDREAAWEFYSYVIVSVDQEQTGEILCWYLDSKQSKFLPHEILKSGG